MAAGGDSWTAKDALKCKVNGDLWFCATTSDTIGVEYTSTCVGYAPQAKSDSHCFSNRMFCAGEAPENATNAEDNPCTRHLGHAPGMPAGEPGGENLGRIQLEV